jgi:hypothetical protein
MPVNRPHRIVSLLLTPLLGLAITNPSAAQAPASPHARYDPRITFAPLSLPDPATPYRSGSGSPGPSYWQNEADYVMHAKLDPVAKVLTNDEVITYTNNSPDSLDCLWIHLEQNTYRKDSRSANLGNTGFGRPPRPGQTAAQTPTRADNHTEGFILESVEVGPAAATAKLIKADYIVDDTRMQIRLATPLKPHGAQLRIHIKYHYAIPGVWGGRTSWGMAEHGEIYDIAQWYPRMCVYDDLRGWDTLPYIGAEFYLEYGHFDYFVTVPWNFILAGSGELVNPVDVLTRNQIARLEQARHSDKTVYIRTPEETSDPTSRPRQTGSLTWHFRMDHTRDVVFTASPTFVWDAARINLPPKSGSEDDPPNSLTVGKIPLAMSVYPVECVGQ